MKSLIMILLMVLCLDMTSHAQKISADKVPSKVKEAFKAKFPQVTNVEWEIESKTEYEANFKIDKVEESAKFDAGGNWLETEVAIEEEELPQKVKEAIAKQFAGYEINEADKVDDAKKGKCFEVEIEKGEQTLDVLFNINGEVLRKTVDED